MEGKEEVFICINGYIHFEEEKSPMEYCLLYIYVF